MRRNDRRFSLFTIRSNTMAIQLYLWHTAEQLMGLWSLWLLPAFILVAGLQFIVLAYWYGFHPRDF